MAKYLTEFNTYADYSGATLSLPNVSLIKSTGQVFYKNIFAGTVLGDILMYDVANQQLISTINANWNTSAFPIADFEPIAINIYPADQTPDGKTRWMSLKWMSNASASGSASIVGLLWGNNSTVVGDITSIDQNAFNGRDNTDKALLLADGTSANTQAAFAAFYATNIFHTNGTSAGDWYVPSYKELSLYQANYSDINAQITLIKNASSSIVNDVNGRQWTSIESNSNTQQSYQIQPFAGGSSGFSTSSRTLNNIGVRGMLSL